MKRMNLNLLTITFFLLILIFHLSSLPSIGISQEKEIVKLAHISSSGAYDILVTNDVAYVSCGYQGVRIFNVSDLSNISEMGSLTEPTTSHGSGFAHQLFLQNEKLFVGDGWGGMRIIDVSDPFHPSELGKYSGDNGPYGWSVKVVNNIAYLSSGFMNTGIPGFLIINVTNPSNPLLIKELVTETDVTDLEVMNSQVFITVENAGVKVFNVTNKSNPIEIGSYFGSEDSSLQFGEMSISKELLFFVNYGFEAQILNISDITDIKLISNNFFISDSLISVAVKKNLAYFSALEDGLGVFEIQNPAAPKKIAHYSINQSLTSDKPYRVYLGEKYIYLTLQGYAWEIFELREKASDSTTGVSYSSDTSNSTESTVPNGSIVIIIFGMIFLTLIRKKQL